MAKTNTPEMIEWIDGQLKGKKAYVTHDDGRFMRVTPVDGDPLCSIEVDRWEGGFIGLKSFNPQP